MILLLFFLIFTRGYYFQCFQFSVPNSIIQLIILNRANFNSNCFSPALRKRTVALQLSPAPTIATTSPTPKRSCSMTLPTCNAPAPGEAAGREGLMLDTFLSVRIGCTGGATCTFGRDGSVKFGDDDVKRCPIGWTDGRSSAYRLVNC